MGESSTGVVFDIRELTVHDGPGIRTTVFMKGCHLRCAWCHNPEGLLASPQMMRSAAGERLVGRTYRSAELASLLNRQGPLLRGLGGVTFSGGEPLMQWAFVAETIAQLEDLHVTLDTSGYAAVEEFLAVVSGCDLVLYDLKLINRQAHRQWTGVDNEPILRNLTALGELGKPFVVRVPLVPGVTDTDENLGEIARCVSGLCHRPRVELLPYNRAAGGKYPACGLAWRPAFDEEAGVNANLDIFREHNLETTLI